MVGVSMNPDNFYKKFFSELHLFRLSHSNVVQYDIFVFASSPTPSIRHALVMEQLQTSLHDYLFHSHTDLFADH